MLGNFKIFETKQFQEALRQDFGGQQVRIKRKLLEYVYPQLRGNPYFGKNIKKLINYQPETWRYRIGGYRFFYTINNQKKILFMITADTRESAY